jgi:hypothetical protein
VDDTAGGEKEDALTEMGFYVPKDAPGLPGAPGGAGGDDEHAAKARLPSPALNTLSSARELASAHACSPGGGGGGGGARCSALHVWVWVRVRRGALSAPPPEDTVADAHAGVHQHVACALWWRGGGGGSPAGWQRVWLASSRGLCPAPLPNGPPSRPSPPRWGLCSSGWRWQLDAKRYC